MMYGLTVAEPEDLNAIEDLLHQDIALLRLYHNSYVFGDH